MEHAERPATAKLEYQKPMLEQQLSYHRLVGVPVSCWTPMLFDDGDFEGEAFDLRN
jgi:hypothetical protein